MNIQIITLCHRMPEWLNIGVKEFTKRLKPFCNLKIIEIPLANRARMSLAKVQALETEKIFNAIATNAYIVALDTSGESLSSETFAIKLNEWQQTKSLISFIIGAPEGLSDPIRQKANTILSISSLTFPHTLVRLILVEQIYRAFMIQQHHPYHK